MAKKPKLLADLFHDTLKDVYFAEKKILATLPKMAKSRTIERTQGRLSEASEGDRRSDQAARRRVQDIRQEADRQEV
jgi:ferritin-like metal-binding protein YciE